MPLESSQLSRFPLPLPTPACRVVGSLWAGLLRVAGDSGFKESSPPKQAPLPSAVRTRRSRAEAHRGRQRARAPEVLARWQRPDWEGEVVGLRGVASSPLERELAPPRPGAAGSPVLPFSSALGPHPSLRPQGDLHARALWEGYLGSAPPRSPKPVSSRNSAGKRRPDRLRGTPGGPGPRTFPGRAPHPSIRPPHNNGWRGCRRSGGRWGAETPGRWKPRPSAGSLTTRAGSSRLLPAPQRRAPGGAGPERSRRAAAAAAAALQSRAGGSGRGALPRTSSSRYEPGKSGGLRPPGTHLRTLSTPQPIRA